MNTFVLIPGIVFYAVGMLVTTHLWFRQFLRDRKRAAGRGPAYAKRYSISWLWVIGTLEGSFMLSIVWPLCAFAVLFVKLAEGCGNMIVKAASNIFGGDPEGFAKRIARVKEET